MSNLVTFSPVDLTESGAPSCGAKVAHDQLAQWAMRLDSIDSIQVVDGGIFPWPRLPIASQDRRGRRAEHLSKMRLISASDFAASADKSVALARLSDYSAIAEFRPFCRSRFPICAVLHSAAFPLLAGSLYSIVLRSTKADRIIVTSTAGHQAMRALLHEAESVLGSGHTFQGELARLPLGVPDELAEGSLDPALCRAILGLRSHDVVFTYVGRFSEWLKADLEPLLRALKNVAEVITDARLILVGSDEGSGYPNYLMDLASKMGISDRVRILTNSTDPEKRLILGASDISVLPSDNIQETFGIAVLETMASGLPVIASNWSGYRDLIEDGKTGFLVDTSMQPATNRTLDVLGHLSVDGRLERSVAQRTVVNVRQLANRMLELGRSSELRKMMGEAGRRAVKSTYIWSKVIRRYDELWRDQLSVPPLPPNGKQPIPFQLSAAFATYPSTSYKQLAFSTERHALEEAGKRFGAREDVRSMIQAAWTQPVPVKEILKHAPTDFASLLFLMAKKGMVSLVDSDPSNQQLR